MRWFAFFRWGSGFRARRVLRSLKRLKSNKKKHRRKDLQLVLENTDAFAIQLRNKWFGPKKILLELLLDLDLTREIFSWSIGHLHVFSEILDKASKKAAGRLEFSYREDLDYLYRCILYVFLANFKTQKPSSWQNRMLWFAQGWIFLERIPEYWTPAEEPAKEALIQALQELHGVLSDQQATERPQVVKLCLKYLDLAFGNERSRVVISRGMRALPSSTRQEDEVIDSISLLVRMAEKHADEGAYGLNMSEIMPALDRVIKNAPSTEAVQKALDKATNRLAKLVPGAT